MKATTITERFEEQEPAAQRVDPRVKYLERHLLEAFDELWDSFVDPAEAVGDVDGTPWNRLGGSPASAAAAGMPFGDEQQLAQIRDQCRVLAVSNEFAINGHENRISYIVGRGHAYRAVGVQGQEAEPLVREVQTVIDEFVRLNHWHHRQQEIVRRQDRDGECFLRWFLAADGTTRVRFVEPAQVTTPSDRLSDPSARFGIQTDPQDVETVLGYWIDGQWVI
jgi:capsid protein